MRYVIYKRVSTKDQGKSGLGLLAQERDIRFFLDQQTEPEVIGTFTEIASGMDCTRPVLKEAIDLAKKDQAVLLVSKLDRLSRKVSFLAGLMDHKKLAFKVAGMPEADKFQLHIYAALAEQERDFISQRTKAALREAKAKGKRLGNPSKKAFKQARTKSLRRRKENADQFALNIVPVIQSIRKAGIGSLRGIAEALNARGILTSRDNQWGAVQVQRVLDRV